MNGTPVLVDSVIIIDHLNGVEAASEFLRSVGPGAHISAITRAEVLTGLDGEVRSAAARMLDLFVFVSIGREIADLAAELRRQHRWKLPDAFQAAAATHLGLKLATRNTDDFNPRRHKFVLVPYRL